MQNQSKPCRLHVTTGNRPPARRWEARMGQKLGGPIDDHAGSLDAKSLPERRGECAAWIFKDIIMPAIEHSGNSIWFSAIPAWRCIQLDLDLLLHVLHLNGVSHCVLFPRHPQVQPLQAPWPASAPAPGPSLQWHRLPSFAAQAQAIGCVGWILSWHQYTNKKLMLTSTITV